MKRQFSLVAIYGLMMLRLSCAPAEGALVVPFVETFSSVNSAEQVHLGFDERWDPGIAPATTEYQFNPIDANWTFAGVAGGSLLVTNPVTGDQAIALNEEGPAPPPIIPGVAITSSPITGFVIGQEYQLTFEHWGDDKPNTNNYELDIKLDASLIGHVSRSFSFTPGFTFGTTTLSFFATATSHTLSFLDVTQSVHGPLAQASAIIDNISLSVIPEARQYLVLPVAVVIISLLGAAKRARVRSSALGDE
jgi:hypothetical protein